MEKNNETKTERQKPFLSRVAELERKVFLLEKRIKTIILSLGTRR